MLARRCRSEVARNVAGGDLTEPADKEEPDERGQHNEQHYRVVRHGSRAFAFTVQANLGAELSANVEIYWCRPAPQAAGSRWQGSLARRRQRGSALSLLWLSGPPRVGGRCRQYSSAAHTTYRPGIGPITSETPRAHIGGHVRDRGVRAQHIVE